MVVDDAGRELAAAVERGSGRLHRDHTNPTPVSALEDTAHLVFLAPDLVALALAGTTIFVLFTGFGFPCPSAALVTARLDRTLDHGLLAAF